MFNLTGKTVAEILKLNNLTEAQLVAHINRYFTNQNYRTDYNKNKNALVKVLANDPIVAKRMAELKAAAKKRA